MRAFLSMLAVSTCLHLHAAERLPSSTLPRLPQSTMCCPCDHCDCVNCQCNGGKVCPCPSCRLAVNAPVRTDPEGTWDVLEELNQQRRQRGLEAYIWDRDLTIAAGRASKHRAERLMFGHTDNDFAYLSSGVSADAAGCAAYPASYGFTACACYDQGLHFAGAAYTLGRDGKRYCHLFIRKVNRVRVAAPVGFADLNCQK